MKRSDIRENVFRLVFCGEFHRPDEFQSQAERYFEEASLPDDEMWICDINEEERKYISEKSERVVAMAPELDRKINQVAKGWRTERMGRPEVAILRLALYEMHYDDEVPVKVAINEAVELAKKYCDDEAPSFINGILAKLVKFTEGNSTSDDTGAEDAEGLFSQPD